LGKLVLEGKAGWDVYAMPWPLLDGRETFLAELGEWFSRHDGRAIRLLEPVNFCETRRARSSTSHVSDRWRRGCP